MLNELSTVGRVFERSYAPVLWALVTVGIYYNTSSTGGLCAREQMKEILQSAVSISGAALAALLAATALLSQAPATAVGVEKLRAANRFNDLLYLLMVSAMAWATTLVISVLMQAVKYPVADEKDIGYCAVLHAVWAASSTVGLVVLMHSFYLVLLSIRQEAKPLKRDSHPVPVIDSEDPFGTGSNVS